MTTQVQQQVATGVMTIVKLRAKPEMQGEFEKALADVADPIRSHPGCLSYVQLQSQDDPPR